jgi:GNAT superfamily N-acetyltransferase
MSPPISPAPPPLTLRELGTEELPLILPLIELHNPKLTPAELRRRLEIMIPQGYRCIAAFHDERLVGVAGYWVGAKFWCGEYLEPDNVFVLPELRSAGIGAKMMDYLEEKARELQCKVVALDSYVTYTGAHKFYIRRNYEIVGFHFIKKTEE